MPDSFFPLPSAYCVFTEIHEAIVLSCRLGTWNDRRLRAKNSLKGQTDSAPGIN